MRVARGFLLILGLLNLVRGGIHLLAPDGGIDSIAGLGRADDQVVLFLFATIGASQMVWGALEIYVVTRLRQFVLMMLGLQTLLTALSVFIMHFYRSPPVDIPGKPFNTALLVMQLAILAWGWYAMRKNRTAD